MVGHAEVTGDDAALTAGGSTWCWCDGEEEGRVMAGVVRGVGAIGQERSAEPGGPALRFQGSGPRGVRRIGPKVSSLWICGGSLSIEPLMSE
jgi:hypothetical protein